MIGLYYQTHIGAYVNGLVSVASVWDSYKIFQNLMTGAYDLQLTSVWTVCDLLQKVLRFHKVQKHVWIEQKFVNTGP